MLQQLIDLLSNNGLLLKKPLNQLPKSSCSSSLEVIDFDAVKDAYMENFTGINHPKSADALYINTTNDELYFIEMKDLTSLVDELKQITDRTELYKKIEEKFIEFRADQKILDSYGLLLDIARHYQIDEAFYPYLIGEDCKIKFLFLVNMSGRDFVRLGFSFQALRHKYEYWLFERANFIRSANFDLFMEGERT